MIKHVSKKTIFLASLIILGMTGFIQNVLRDNFSKAGSSFQKEKVSLTQDVINKVYADVVTAPPAPGDGSGGSGDGSNGF